MTIVYGKQWIEMYKEKIGKVLNFSKKWYPLSSEVFLHVQVDNSVISIPINYKQKTVIEEEYPVNSQILLAYSDSGEWHILSRHLNPVTLKKILLN
jgi:hypothetical protein